MRKFIGAALLLALLVLAPQFLSISKQEVLVFMTINVLVVVSYRLMTLTGEWSLIHAVIMGVGAYASALTTKYTGLPVLLAMPIGGLVAAAIAFLLSFPLLRMKGFYFLIGSFAAGEIIRLLWKRMTIPFGGNKGLKGVDAVPDVVIGSFHFSGFNPTHYYYFALVVVIFCCWILWRIEKSLVGLTYHSVHWQDKLAQASGIDTRKYRQSAFIISSFFAGIGGALFAHYLGTINPGVFDIEQMVYILTWAIVGGTQTFYGPILGCVVLTTLNEIFLRSLGYDQVRPLVYGLVLIASVLFLPGGLESLVEKFRVRFLDKPKDTSTEAQS